MMNSSKNIEGYTRRSTNVDWKTLYAEYKSGTGPEKSLMYSMHPMNYQIQKSSGYKTAIEEFVASGEKKFKSAPFFNPLNSDNQNMTAQFIGKANFNFYEVGDKIVVIVIDSKSISSETLNPLEKFETFNIPRVEGKTIPNSTTHQTYLFIIPTSIKKDYEKK